MFNVRPYNAIDFYKADHKSQYPEGTNFVYSNFTPRSFKRGTFLFSDNQKAVVFGIQAIVQALIVDLWNKEFFDKSREEVIAYYKRRMDTSLGENAIKMNHMIELHDLGYLPISIKAFKEGTLVQAGIPVLTISNTIGKFFWLVNYFETMLSACLWKPMTSATVAYQYRMLLELEAGLSGGDKSFISFQGHDFSFRGMSGLDDAASSGAGHLLSFVGTDTIPAIDFMEDYYHADCTKELIGCSVPATEHSVMCMGEKENEIETFIRLIRDIYPAGIVSIVSDTWDFWKVITEFMPMLKDMIMARDGKVVIRPDSGDPVRIIAGYAENEIYREADGRIFFFINEFDYCQVTEAEVKGAVQCLWDTFGGTTNEKDFKRLDSHIGLIYGDSITLKRAQEILQRLRQKGFSSDNVVFGIGSYTYQYTTRDSLGFAMKATYGEVNGVGREIFKAPATDSGEKKSAKGMLCVEQERNDELVLLESCTWEEEQQGLLEKVFENGVVMRKETLSQIRERLLDTLKGYSNA